jgi:hypothetical protein
MGWVVEKEIAGSAERQIHGYSPYKLPTPLQGDQSLANHLIKDHSTRMNPNEFQA